MTKMLNARPWKLAREIQILFRNKLTKPPNRNREDEKTQTQKYAGDDESLLYT